MCLEKQDCSYKCFSIDSVEFVFQVSMIRNNDLEKRGLDAIKVEMKKEILHWEVDEVFVELFLLGFVETTWMFSVLFFSLLIEICLDGFSWKIYEFFFVKFTKPQNFFFSSKIKLYFAWKIFFKFFVFLIEFKFTNADSFPVFHFFPAPKTTKSKNSKLFAYSSCFFFFFSLSNLLLCNCKIVVCHNSVALKKSFRPITKQQKKTPEKKESQTESNFNNSFIVDDKKA